MARFLPNPEKHWGPKLRAGRQVTSKHISLLGEEAVNGSLENHKIDDDDEIEDGKQPEAKRPKVDNSASEP